MKLTINIVDAFTDKQFGGNSAAVIITDTWLPDGLMQSIATENNLSETAFLVPQDPDFVASKKHLHNHTHNHPNYAIRWFSPLMEIDFCGHATLASAWVIFAKHPNLSECSIVAPAVGNMLIKQNHTGEIEMDFPNRKPVPVVDVPAHLCKGLSIKPKHVLKNDQAYVAVYENEQEVSAVEQDTALIKQLAPYDVVVTAKAAKPGTGYDFVSRYFWPASGGDEDPVTGSIHTALAPYWAEQVGKINLTAYQASKRGGLLNCKVNNGRVIIAGKAVPYLEGTITVQP